MRKNADVVIIGGGSIGCSVAYNLALKGFKSIVLLEKRYVTSGSTGRCGAGIRQQWGTEININLSRLACNLFLELGEKTGYGDIEFRQSGYLMITYDKQQADRLSKNLVLQQSLGVPAKRLTGSEAKDVVPYLNIDGMEAAFYCKEDGCINPFKATFAFEKGARDLGVEFEKYTEVLGIETESGKIKAVVTDKGTINTPLVVNATGPYAKFIGKMIGVSHPVEPERHQILVTEPLEHMVGPLVMSFNHDSYINQQHHGGFVMGYGIPNEPKRINYNHDWSFMEEMAKKSVFQIPALKDVRIVRQWAGHYGISPDGQPIVGSIPEVEGYYTALGCGKGFMLSPAIGLLLAEHLSGEKTTLDIEPMNVRRFEKGELIFETGVV